MRECNEDRNDWFRCHGSAIVDLSSVGPGTSRKLYDFAKEQGVFYADAPVSGGVSGATNGTLTIMFGGDEETWQKVQPVLKIIGKKLVYVGGIGSGEWVYNVQTIKTERNSGGFECKWNYCYTYSFAIICLELYNL